MAEQLTPEEMLLLDNQLCFALYAASKAMTQAYRPFLTKLGITYPQYLAFLVLWQEDGISLKSLGKRLYLDSGTLTPLLKRLEKQGFVERRRFQQDEREIRIFLTEKGRQLKEEAKEIPENMLCKVSMDTDEVIAIRDQVKRLLVSLVDEECPS